MRQIWDDRVWGACCAELRDVEPRSYLDQLSSGAYLLAFGDWEGERVFALRFEDDPAALESWAKELYEIGRDLKRACSAAHDRAYERAKTRWFSPERDPPSPVVTHVKTFDVAPKWRLSCAASHNICDLEFVDDQGAPTFALRFSSPEGIVMWGRALMRIARRLPPPDSTASGGAEGCGQE